MGMFESYRSSTETWDAVLQVPGTGVLEWRAGHCKESRNLIFCRSESPGDSLDCNACRWLVVGVGLATLNLRLIGNVQDGAKAIATYISTDILKVIRS